MGARLIFAGLPGPGCAGRRAAGLRDPRDRTRGPGSTQTEPPRPVVCYRASAANEIRTNHQLFVPVLLVVAVAYHRIQRLYRQSSRELKRLEAPTPPPLPPGAPKRRP